MVRSKLSEVKTRIQLDNIVYFQAKELPKTIKAKDLLKLEQCGKTRGCITGEAENPYSCGYFNKCNNLKEVLKLFI